MWWRAEAANPGGCGFRRGIWSCPVEGGSISSAGRPWFHPMGLMARLGTVLGMARRRAPMPVSRAKLELAKSELTRPEPAARRLQRRPKNLWWSQELPRESNVV
jgi:hypothetical protein